MAQLKTHLENLITNAWQEQAWWLWLFMPVMLLYWLSHSFHKGLYALSLKKAYKADIPVFVIGNITVGGSGKTPLLIAFVKYLQSQNIAVAVISRGYGGTVTESTFVTHDNTPADIGDEPYLIHHVTGVTVCVGRNRSDSIKKIKNTYADTQLILCDDGLQHYKLAHDHAWIVYDAKRGLGNKMLLPVGFLREWGSRLTCPKVTDTVIHHVIKPEQAESELYFSLKPQGLTPLFYESSMSEYDFKQLSNVHAVTGIGYPVRFFNSLTDQGFEIIEHSFPDHHVFNKADLTFADDLPIIVTAKDGVKIKLLALPEILKQKIWVLPVEASLSKQSLSVFKTQLEKLGIN